MKFYRFDRDVARDITRFKSRGAAIASILRKEGVIQVGCIYIAAGGVLGYHPAVVPQLFLVIQGEGWVRNETTTHIRVKPGIAVFWEPGEGHESGSETGMTAMVLEGEGIEPEQWMKEITLEGSFASGSDRGGSVDVTQDG
jgi:quercetin dioxygenase-like cupin family protein